jgi:hypothetical protein
MKYSLRSLMTFSIRDLMFITLIAAILAAWWYDHWWLSRQLWMQDAFKHTVK